MSRYRKIEVRTWSDEKFRALSAMPASGQGLWFFLLTGPHTGPIPGLFRAGRAGMAEELGWEVEAFDKAFVEVFRQGMAKADFKARLVWLPNAIKHNKPESPNVVRSWCAEFDLLPECALKDEAAESLRAFICALGEGFAKAFSEGIGKPSGKPSGKPLPKAMPNQEQEQEQEQEQKQDQEQEEERKKDVAPESCDSRRPRKPNPIPKANKQPTLTSVVWSAYAHAYLNRYAHEPVRNARINGQLAHFIQRVPQADAAPLAAWFVAHNRRWYVQQMHPIGALLADAEALHTQWRQGRTLTEAEARETDGLQKRGAMWAEFIEEGRQIDARAAALASQEDDPHG